MGEKRHIDGLTLKTIAFITMIIDHVGVILEKLPENTRENMTYITSIALVFRMIGRISMPLFAFCISEGFFYTGDERKYALRMFIFAILSEVPFNYFISGRIIYTESCNVLFTFTIAIFVLSMCRYCDRIGKRAIVIEAIFVILGMGAAYVLKTDYSYRGVALVVLFYYTRFNPYFRYVMATLILWMEGNAMSLAAPLSLVIIYFYNGKRKGSEHKGNIFLGKWIFYYFYPLQFIILGLVKRYING